MLEYVGGLGLGLCTDSWGRLTRARALYGCVRVCGGACVRAYVWWCWLMGAA